MLSSNAFQQTYPFGDTILSCMHYLYICTSNTHYVVSDRTMLIIIVSGVTRVPVITIGVVIKAVDYRRRDWVNMRLSALIGSVGNFFPLFLSWHFFEIPKQLLLT